MDGAEFDLPGCLQRVRGGDEAAARELFRQFYPYVLAIVRAHLPARTDEEDLCQMIFVKLFSCLDQYTGNGSFAHWLARIAVNTCLNQLRHEKRRPEIRHADLGESAGRMLDQLTGDARALPDSDAEAARELVEQLLSGLAPKERLVITFLHLEERSVREVSAMTGWNPAVVKVRAFRARQKLRARFDRIEKEAKS
ncbi:MAG: RNA polymerase sigma factor [Terrimicrobiaceae bacterium]|nr:RNA polymerase sigma factor [Terrimicrobiaceae bacterium]